MDLVRPRYEFRSFQDDLSLLEEQIFARGTRESFDHPESDDLQDICDDIYFVRPQSTGRSLKIRNDRLELKALLGHEGDLELWQPVVSVPFPVPWEQLRDGILPDLRIAETSSRFDRGSLLRTMTEVIPRVLIQHVRKTRKRFRLDGILVTLDRMRVNGASVESVTIESDCTEHVEEARQQLGLSDAENISMPRMLSRIAGLLPEEVLDFEPATCA